MRSVFLFVSSRPVRSHERRRWWERDTAAPHGSFTHYYCAALTGSTSHAFCARSPQQRRLPTRVWITAARTSALTHDRRCFDGHIWWFMIVTAARTSALTHESRPYIDDSWRITNVVCFHMGINLAISTWSFCGVRDMMIHDRDLPLASSYLQRFRLHLEASFSIM